MRQLSLSDCAAAKPPKCNYQAQRGASFHFETHFSQICIPLKWKHLKCCSKLSLSVHLNRYKGFKMCQQMQMEFGKAKCFLRELFDKWKERDSDSSSFFSFLKGVIDYSTSKSKEGEKRSLECSQNKRFCPHHQLKQGACAL